MKNTETSEPQAPGQFAAAHGWAAGDEYSECDDDDCCSMCGGDGLVLLSECGPSEWGEDCFCDQDRIVTCPECRFRARYEATKTEMAKRPNDPSSATRPNERSDC